MRKNQDFTNKDFMLEITLVTFDLFCELKVHMHVLIRFSFFFPLLAVGDYLQNEYLMNND